MSLPSESHGHSNGCAPLTDAGLVHLMGLTNLHELSLRNNQITDAGLVHLKGLTELNELDLRRTKVTEAGVTKLKEPLPNCLIPFRQ